MISSISYGSMRHLSGSCSEEGSPNTIRGALYKNAGSVMIPIKLEEHSTYR
jgi:hypothetical protein